ncbi:MAG TPA: phage integrase SAM-like domain-containing protein [Phnomibacter sp.]|nr:phage integrase SAM-like domain-containing protein [Phnomibacter sp.]
MATINFYIQSKNNPAGIYVRLKEGKLIDAKAKTNFLIDPSQWSQTKNQPKNLKDESFKNLNQELQLLRADLLNHYNNCAAKQPINSKWLKEFLNPTLVEENIPTKLVDYYDYYILHKQSLITLSSCSRLRVNKRLVEKFQKHNNTEYYIKDVNADFRLEFEAFCRQEKYAQNTIARSLKSIKTICYHARNNGIETHFQLNSLALKNEKVEKIYLDLDEIALVENAEIKLDHLNNARDWLIISCETGQRISDFMRFHKDQIRLEGNVPLIEFTQVKTGKIMAVPLSKKVREILDKRGGNFPRPISDQRYNDYIKEVGKIAGLKEKITGSKINKDSIRKEKGLYPKYELITSHIGRRSFATNNYGRIPTSLLISVTGHSTETMFLEYIGKTVTEKARQLAEYF